MKNKLAIYGAGGFGREVAVMISQINQAKPTWDVIGFFDDHKEINGVVDGLTILGGIHQINQYSSNLSICIAIADPTLRGSLAKRIVNTKISFPVVVHPTAILGDVNRNTFGAGSIITAGVILTTGVRLGEFCILNLASTIGHDVTFGNYCTVMPGCSISGNVILGEGILMGTGSRIIQGIHIGAHCMIGAGSVVTKRFGDRLKILGVPARAMKFL